MMAVVMCVADGERERMSVTWGESRLGDRCTGDGEWAFGEPVDCLAITQRVCNKQTNPKQNKTLVSCEHATQTDRQTDTHTEHTA